MKQKHLIILIVVAIALALFSWLIRRSNEEVWKDGGGATGGRTILAQDVATEQIGRVTIQSGDNTITLEKQDDGWKVQNRFGYPANFAELKEFIFDLNETRIAQTLPVDDAQRQSLQLTKEQGAVTVALETADGKTMQTLVFGQKIEKESGQPAMPAMPGMMGMGGGNTPVGRYLELEDKRVVTTNHTFGLVDEQVSFWLDKDFFKISDLKSATLSEQGEPLWTVSREHKSADLALLTEIPEDREADNSKLNSMKSAFSWIRFNDVANPEANPEELGMDKAKTLSVTDFDGFVYVIRFGTQIEGKQYLNVTFDWKGETERQPGEEEQPEDKERLDADFARKVKEQQDKVKEWQAKLSPWTYEVGTYALNSVNKTLDELLKDKPKPEPEPDAEPQD